ncbi:hypothetical protein PVAP13_1NG481700 [Panicum virgatum]|uniref:Uncharacterized protein n=1 Tax=Panicum virgatum TaxID=38727 RepID=A0A8T0X5J8_PANVG|nr:hypothetical protein PVAP13_1NG481700 [Panicum virgatum]
MWGQFVIVESSSLPFPSPRVPCCSCPSVSEQGEQCRSSVVAAPGEDGHQDRNAAAPVRRQADASKRQSSARLDLPSCAAFLGRVELPVHNGQCCLCCCCAVLLCPPGPQATSGAPPSLAGAS